MADRPDRVPLWATTPTEYASGTPVESGKDVIAPTTAFAAGGWLEGNPVGPIRQYLNWFWRKTGEWLLYLAENTTSSHGSVEEAYAAIENTGVSFVSVVSDVSPFGEIDTAALTGASVVCADGVQVYAAGASNLRGYDRDCNQVWTQAIGSIADLATNGDKIAIVVGTNVSVRECSDGTSFASGYGHGATINAVAIGHSDYVVIAGASGTNADGTGTVRCLTYTGGTLTEVWTYAHGATCEDVVIIGDRVFVAGAEGGGGAYVRCLDLATGAGVFNITGSGVNATAIAADELGGVVITDDTGSEVKRFTGLNGIPWTANIVGGFVSVDDRFAHVVVASSGITYTLDKQTGATLHFDGSGDDAAVYSDGDRLFVAAGTGTDELQARQLPYRPRPWRKASHTEVNKPAQQLIYPIK